MKIALVLIAVLMIDVMLLFFASLDVDQTRVARAYRTYGESPREENLRARDQLFAAASQQQARNRLFAFVGIVVVTSAGAFMIGQTFERQRRKSGVYLSHSGTPTI